MKGMAKCQTVRAKDGKAGEGGDKSTKTLVVSTLALSNDTTVEEGGAAKGADIASVVEEDGGIRKR